MPPSAADRALPFLEAAAAAIAAGDLDEARAQLDEALRVDPQSLEGLYALALLAHRQGNLSEAVAHLERLLELDPYNDDARVDLARIQWRAGYSDDALASVGTVIDRHPQMPLALDLRTRIRTGAGPSPSKWQPLLRGNLSLGFDSNVSLLPDQVASTAAQGSGKAAAFAHADVLGGIFYDSDVRPLSAFAFASLQTAFNDRPIVEGFIPSVFGGAATGRLALGPVVGTIDGRYQEIFTGLLDTPVHIGRIIGPSLSAAIAVHEAHTLRVLVGSDIFMPDAAATETNAAIHASLRDRMTLGSLGFVVEGGFRHNLNTQDALTANTGFTELGGALYAEYGLLDALDLFALFDGRGRLYEADAGVAGGEELALRAEAGVRYTIGLVELHIAYGFGANLLGAPGRDEYTRHRVNGGVRFWYP